MLDRTVAVLKSRFERLASHALEANRRWGAARREWRRRQREADRLLGRLVDDYLRYVAASDQASAAGSDLLEAGYDPDRHGEISPH